MGTAASGDAVASTSEQVPDDIRRLYEKIDRDEEDFEDLKVFSFEINQNQIELFRKR